MGHSRFVNCVAFLQPNAVYPNGMLEWGTMLMMRVGLVVTGGMDKMILIWDTETSAEPIMTLIEHEDAVCHLSTLGDLIVSSSWDRCVFIASRKCHFSELVESGGWMNACGCAVVMNTQSGPHFYSAQPRNSQVPLSPLRIRTACC